jgi:hypothetical protein
MMGQPHGWKFVLERFDRGREGHGVRRLCAHSCPLSLKAVNTQSDCRIRLHHLTPTFLR